MDETDYILSSKYVTNNHAMDMLKHITNTMKVCMVCVGQPNILTLRNNKQQYKLRFPKKQLPRFKKIDEDFLLFLEEVEKQISPPQRIGLADINKNYPQLLHGMSNGIVRIIILTIQEAYRILGVCDEDFNDLSNVRFKAEILKEAYHNIMGDLDEKEIEDLTS